MNHHSNKELRLGNLLVKQGIITRKQLAIALTYQNDQVCKLGVALKRLGLATNSQISRTLKRQSSLRNLAGSIALACSSISVVTADPLNSKPATSLLQHKVDFGLTDYQPTVNSKIQLTSITLDEQSKAFYFSGTNEHLFSLNTNLSEKFGIQFSLFSTQQSDYLGPYTYELEPQISLYSSFSKPSKRHLAPKKIGPGLDRASNTIPVIFMLTLKGRALYENSGNKTTMWSLNRAKKGVQRKAELMFSVTKHF